MSATLWLKFQQKLKAGGRLRLVARPGDNLVDRIWTEGRPSHEDRHKQIFVHDLRWAGESWRDKVTRLRTVLRGDCGGDYNTSRSSNGGGGSSPFWGMVVTEYDEIAWLFNLRGRIKESQASLWAASNLRHTPVFESLALVTMAAVVLWLPGPALADPQLATHLKDDLDCRRREGVDDACAVRLLNVSTSVEDLAELMRASPATRPSSSVDGGGGRILVSSASPYEAGASYAVLQAVGPAAKIQVSLR
jgi:hypothetical protein